jgi:hypothetical protein
LLKSALYVLLRVIAVVAVAWIITIILGLIPLPFMDTVAMVVWIVAGICCLFIVGRFLIALIPSDAP